mgnify:FL=1
MGTDGPGSYIKSKQIKIIKYRKMKGRKSKMNKLQEEIENRHLPELMRLDNGDAVTNYEDWKLRREEIEKAIVS